MEQNSSLLESINNFSEILDTGITVKGRVANHVRFYGDTLSFSIRTDEISIKNIDNGLERILKIEEVMPVIIKADSSGILSSLKRDDLISIKCQTKNKPDRYYLYGYATGVNRVPSATVKDALYNLRGMTYKCIRSMFYTSLKDDPASLCEAIVLGNTGNLSSRVSSDFKKGGIYHLLAISGLHISFFILLISSLINFIFLRESNGKPSNKWSGLAGIFALIVILFFYNFLVGGKASTIRSTMMSVYFLISCRVGREIHRKTVLSYIFIILLIINPGFFYEPGFWLSFIAVFAILYANKPVLDLIAVFKEKLALNFFRCAKEKNKNHRMARVSFLTSIAVTTFSVNIFILPLLLHIFNEASLLSLLTNLPAIPVFYILLFILIISTIAGLIWPPAGEILIKPSTVLIGWLKEIAASWRFFRFSIIESGDFDVIHLIIYYIFLLSVLIIVSRIIERWTGKETG